MLVILIVIIASASLLVSAYAAGWFNSGHVACGNMSSSSVPAYARFAVVISEAGYNDSQHHTGPWPIMNVTVGRSVTINVWNNDTLQTHGFAIKHYFEQGVALRPGQSCNVYFYASQAGSFPVYNTVFDTTEIFEHAILNVNPQT